MDGTYELFRYFFALPSHMTDDGREVAAVRGVLGSVLQLIEQGATHVGVATDHVIESFRNDLYPGYKTGAGIDPALRAQFTPLEQALAAMGVVVWAMVDVEADDALASAAAVCHDDPACEQTVICTPDKDLAQCVCDGEVVQLDRRKGAIIDEPGVLAKFGVAPESIPDWLALVGDSADGFRGLPGWGPKSAATILRHYRHIEAIPDAIGQWEVGVRGSGALAATLAAHRPEAMLFKDLATLRVDRALLGRAADLRWPGPTDAFAAVADTLEAPNLASRAQRLAAAVVS